MSRATDFAQLQRLAPAEAIAYMAGRGLTAETYHWYDLWRSEHERAFTVSRLARADLLEAMQSSIAKSVAGDMSRRDWIRDAEKLLKDAGWWGTTEVTDPRTGEVLATRFNHARLQLIFDTNTRQAAAAGQWQRLLRNQRTQPYARYVAMDDDRTRPQHRAWHNVTLPLSDAWWTTHRPPNGYRCRCRIVGVSKREYDQGEVLDRPGAETDRAAPIRRTPMVKTAPPDVMVDWRNPATKAVEKVPAGIDPGFDYSPGTDGASKAFKAMVQAKLARLSPGIAGAVRADLLSQPPADLVPDPAPWRAQTGGTAEGDWHDASFQGAPQWLKEAVAKRGALQGGVVRAKGVAHYSAAKDQINMGSLDKTSLVDQGTWRHEYGHAMDRSMQKGAFFRSTAPDFTDAMKEDARELIALGGHGNKSLKATKTAQAKLQAAYANSAQALLQAPDKAQWLADRYAKNGLDFAQVQATMKAHTDFATNLQGVGLHDRYARIITAVEQRDAQGLIDALTGGMGPENTVERLATFDKGTVGNLSDLFGSATSNKVSGASKSGFGHSDAYYKNTWASQAESFANLASFYGDASPVWGQIIEAMTPRMAQLFKEIMK